MTNKNIGLIGLLGIPVIIGYMYWVKRSNIKEIENDIRNTEKFGKYDTDYKSKIDKEKSRLNKEKNSYLPSTFTPIGLDEKITDNVSDFYNSAIKTPYRRMTMRRGGKRNFNTRRNKK
jgi:hypothetical protein